MEEGSASNYTNLHSYPVDGQQRISYGQTASRLYGGEKGDSGAGDGVMICKQLVLGCKPETVDDFGPFVFEPTWCVYIRALDAVDMGRYVKRVTFRMSPRLPLRLHVADTSPFEITEVLSTDFPVELQVEYVDSNMSATTYMYKPNDAFDGKYNVDLRMTFQGHERRDKMFFMNPTPVMAGVLTTPTAQTLRTPSSELGTREAERSERAAKRQKAGQLSPATMTETSTSSLEFLRSAVSSPTAPRPIFNVRRRLSGLELNRP